MTKLAIESFQDAKSGLVPGFDLVVSGVQLTEAEPAMYRAIRTLIQSVTFEEDEEMSSQVEIMVVNQPETGPGKPVNWRAVIDSKVFAEGNFIDLHMGYGTQRTFMDRLEIVKWLPKFPEGSGPATLAIQAFDGRHKMQKANKNKGDKPRKTFHTNTPDELIVDKIAKKYGFKSDTDPTESKKKAVKSNSKKGKKKVTQHVIPTRVQGSDKSDWAFLQKIADMNNFDLWVDWDRVGEQYTVHFKKKPDHGSPEYKFTYNGGDGSLISAEPDFSIQDQPTDVEVLVFDKKTRKVELTVIYDTRKSEEVVVGGGRANPGYLQAQKSIAAGASVRFTAFGQTIEAFADRPFRSKKEAASFVQKWLKEREQDFLLMQGKVVGLPTLRPRQIHELAGLGGRLDGFYRFTNVRHIMEPGGIYHCEFTAHKILSDAISRRPPITVKPSKTKGRKERKKKK